METHKAPPVTGHTIERPYLHSCCLATTCTHPVRLLCIFFSSSIIPHSPNRSWMECITSPTRVHCLLSSVWSCTSSQSPTLDSLLYFFLFQVSNLQMMQSKRTHFVFQKDNFLAHSNTRPMLTPARITPRLWNPNTSSFPVRLRVFIVFIMTFPPQTHELPLPNKAPRATSFVSYFSYRSVFLYSRSVLRTVTAAESRAGKSQGVSHQRAAMTM